MGTQALIFIVGFLIVLGIYITIIVMVSRRLNERVTQSTFSLIERLFIAGIILGIVAMFQPWLFKAYTVGFSILLFSTLGFILWSHVTPALPNYDSGD